MTRTIHTTLLFAVAATVVAVAQQGLNGIWQGETRSGTPIVLTLVVKESALTGTFKRGDETITITDGKVSKNTFAFKAVMNGQSEGVSGELAGEELKVWLDRQGASTAITLRRAPAQK